MVKTARDAGTVAEYSLRLSGLDCCASLVDELGRMKEWLDKNHNSLRDILTALVSGEEPDMTKVGKIGKELTEGRDKLMKLTDFAKHTVSGLTRESKQKKDKGARNAAK